MGEARLIHYTKIYNSKKILFQKFFECDSFMISGESFLTMFKVKNFVSMIKVKKCQSQWVEKQFLRKSLVVVY